MSPTRMNMSLDLVSSQDETLMLASHIFSDQFVARLHCSSSLLVHYFKIKQNQDTDITPNKQSKLTLKNFLKSRIHDLACDLFWDCSNAETFSSTQRTNFQFTLHPSNGHISRADEQMDTRTQSTNPYITMQKGFCRLNRKMVQ